MDNYKSCVDGDKPYFHVMYLEGKRDCYGCFLDLAFDKTTSWPSQCPPCVGAGTVVLRQ